MFEARRIDQEEAKKWEEEYQNDNRQLMLTGYHYDHVTVRQLDSFQTIGFNLKGLLDGTNTNKFVITLATNEDIAYFEEDENEAYNI